MTPFTGLLFVDPTRVGGGFSSHRHAFGMAPQPPAAPAIEPPPRRVVLSEGIMQASRLSEAEIKDLRADLDPVADALQMELEVVKVEADSVSGPTLRVEPDAYKSISIVGPYFTPQQIRSQIIMDARGIGSLADRALSGALSSYLSADEGSKIRTVSSDAKKLVAYMEQFDLAPLEGANAKLAQQHLETHTKAVTGSIQAAEKKVVSGEAVHVPIKEQSEVSAVGTPWGALIAIGTIVVVGILVAELA